MKIKLVSLFTLGCALALAGCTTTEVDGPANPLTTQAVTTGTIRSADPYTKTNSIMAPQMKLALDFGGGHWLLRRLTSEHDLVVFQLYVDYWAGSWAFLNATHDSKGAELETTSIDRSVPGYGVSEIVGITLTREYLDAHRHADVDLRIDGQRRSIPLIVPGYYIDGFLTAVDLPSHEVAAK